MQPADGVIVDAVHTRRHHWRGALIGVGVAVAAGFLLVLAPQPAQADTGDSGLVGSLVKGLATTVTEVVEPVVAPLPDVRDLPVVGGLVGQVADSRPVSTVTTPVAGLVDGLLGDTVGSLPVVGGLLGNEPVGSITTPVGEAVDGAVGEIVGTVPDPEVIPGGVDVTPGAPAPETLVASGLFTSAITWPIAASSLVQPVGELATATAAGAEGLFHGPVSALGDIAPTSAATAGGPPFGLAAAVLGAGLLFLLARGRARPVTFRAPPSPVFATDTSPD